MMKDFSINVLKNRESFKDSMVNALKQDLLNYLNVLDPSVVFAACQEIEDAVGRCPEGDPELNK